jgi:hypothetical protein
VTSESGTDHLGPCHRLTFGSDVETRDSFEEPDGRAWTLRQVDAEVVRIGRWPFRRHEARVVLTYRPEDQPESPETSP